MTVAFYDTKPYDRELFAALPGSGEMEWRFHEFRLNAATAMTVAGAHCVRLRQ